MPMCYHAKFCGKRIVGGDRANGCNEVDQASCHPTMTLANDTPTAPSGGYALPYRRCTNCARTMNRRDWEATNRNPMCVCGSWSWLPVSA